MKISIISATYNCENHIDACLQSVQEQTHVIIEHIIIDGGSTDGTLDRLKSFQSTTKIISEPDNGIYDALNKGINLATGDIIGFVHSDDMLASASTIETIAKVFETTNADGVYGDLRYVSKEDTNKTIRHWKSKPFKRKNLTYGWMPAHPTLFLKREVYKKHGNFDLSLKIAADYDFMLRILKDPELKFEYLPQVVTKMRVGGASNKSLTNIIKKSKEDLKAIRKNKIGGLHTLFFKNIRKITQFINRE